MMSLITKWKYEKTKMKVVFRLQFQATHIPQSGWDKLFVSFAPSDAGKSTAKTSKASVRNGSCKWSDPIYETTRLLQDPKTKAYDEKLYKLVVAMGSSRSSLLGEVFINLADFIDALKPSSAALPLHCCDFGTILHVTVQLLSSKTGFREFEQQRELSVRGIQASSGKRIHDQNEDLRATSGAFEHRDKVNARARFKEDSTGLPSLEEVGELKEEYEDLAAGVDCSSYTSESLYAEKNDFSCYIELDGLKSRVTGDVTGFEPVHSSSTEKGTHNNNHLSTQLSNDWSHGCSSDYSVDNDLASTYEGSGGLTARLQMTESSVLLLKSEATSLQNISDELFFETQNFAQQLAVELASGEKLAKEVDILKSECWKFRNDLDELKAASASQNAFRKTPSTFQAKCFTRESSFDKKLVDSAIDKENSHHLPCDFHSKLLHEIFLIGCKVQQIQNEACFGCNGNGLKYIYSGFDDLGILIQNLKQSIEQEFSAEAVSGIHKSKDQYSLGSLSEQHVQVENDGRFFADFYYPEGIMKEKACELLEQLEVSESEDKSLTKRMAKVNSYYEGIIHKLEDKQKQTSDQLKNLRVEHASCFYAISALQNQTEKLHEELDGQSMRFAEDRHNLESFINDLEKKAISSETMLKRVRWSYAIAVDRLQKDLELLSFQVLSMYETNESLAKQALFDATGQHYGEHLREMEQWHRGESFISLNQTQQKPAHAEIQHDIPQINGDHDSCAIFDGVSGKFNHKMLHNFSSKVENKGMSDLYMDLEATVNKEPNASVNVLKLYDISSAASTHGVMQEGNMQEGKGPSFFHDSLMEKQRSSCLHSLPVQKSITHSQISNNLENVKDIYHYLPPEDPQISNVTETMKDAYHCSPGYHMVDYVVCLEGGETYVDVQNQLHVSSSVELLEVFNLELEVHAQVLQEALREVFTEMGHLKVVVVELQKKMELSTNNEEFLILKLHTALDESRTLMDAEAQCISRYNDLASTCHIMEVKLNETFVERNLLAEVVDCRSLIANFRVYESRYKICIAEKNDLENILKEENSKRTYLQDKVSVLIEELKLLKEQYAKKCSLNTDLQKGAASLQRNFGRLCKIIFCNQQDDSIFDDIYIKQELECENYDDINSHLEQFLHKVYCSLFRLQQEKTVANEQIEIVQCKLNEKELLILDMKHNFQSELDEVREKLKFSTTEFEYLQIEFQEKLEIMKEAEERNKLENVKLLSSIFILEVELQQATDECRGFYQKILEADIVEEEIARTKLGIMDLIEGNRNLSSTVLPCNDTSTKMEYEISSLKDILHNARDRLFRLQLQKKVAEEQRDVAQCILTEKESHILDMKQKFESELEEARTKLEYSRTKSQHLHIEHQDALKKLMLCKEAEESHRLENDKLLSRIFILEAELQQATEDCRDFSQKLLAAETVNEEVANTKSRFTDLIQENKVLLSSIQSGNKAAAKMEYELSSLKESLHYAHDKLHSEIKTREELEASNEDLKLQVLETSQQLLAFNEQNAEFCHLKMWILGLDKGMQQYAVFCGERAGKIDDKTLALYLEDANMENHLVAAFGHSLSVDIELAFMVNQFCSKMVELVMHQKVSKIILEDLHLKHLDVAISLKKHIVNEAGFMTERDRLSTDLMSAESTIEALFVEKEILLVYIAENTISRADFEVLKGRAAISKANYAKEKQQYEDEICLLKHMLRLEELDDLWLMKIELDMMVVFLGSKLIELGKHVVLLEECDSELKCLREKHIDLIQKLSEQILMTEEFKNLSIHLRELKDKEDTECYHSLEKRESEGSSFAVQESLRTAFIKEQYESKIHELRSQCSISRKYAEEMLMKLQISLNDNESRKKNEAHLSKRNEELSFLLSDLESELQSVKNDRRELIKAYERMNTELECTILTLECCKEEKQKLQNSLKESNEEREKIRVELDLVKRLLENMASAAGTGVGRNYESDNADARLIGELIEDDPRGFSFILDKASRALGTCSEDKVVEPGGDLGSVTAHSILCMEIDDVQLTNINGVSFMSISKLESTLKEASVDRTTILEDNAIQISYIKKHFWEQQRLINDMEILHKQLQKLKRDNSEYQLQEVFDADLESMH